MTEGEPDIQVVEMGKDCVLALFISLDEEGYAVRVNARGIDKAEAIVILRQYCYAAERGLD
jgi:hypothetical protein